MKNLAAMLLVVAVMLLASRDAVACGCPGLPPESSDEVFTAEVAREYKKAAAVFSGEVVAKEYRPVEGSPGDNVAGKEVLTIRIAAEGWWKGGPTAEVVLYTKIFRYPDGSGSGTSCEYNFEKGQKYLVYAFGRADKLSTHACARTQLMKYAERDIKALDKLKQDESGR